MRQQSEPILRAQQGGRLERVADGVAQFHGFCNVGMIYGGGECVVVDTSNARLGARAAEALREATSELLAFIVYTHGHMDHVGGAPAFLASAKKRDDPRPQIWAHESVPERLARYRATWGWNDEVNRQQFRLPKGVAAFTTEIVPPDHTYRDEAAIELAGERLELHHAKAETDDATWVWIPGRRVALVGDLSVQSLPNTGNPNKVQRYTLGWAEALERIAALRPEIVIPGHGDPLVGEYALEVLTETARALRYLHDAVLERLNAGQWPDEIVDADIRLPDDLSSKSYLQPIYGCDPFVVRDVLRAYAGWWGGNPAELIPARRADVARDLLDATGREALIAKVRELARAGEPRRALHLAVLLPQSDAADVEGHALVAELCEVLSEGEPSFIVRSFYLAAAARARARSGSDA